MNFPHDEMYRFGEGYVSLQWKKNRPLLMKVKGSMHTWLLLILLIVANLSALAQVVTPEIRQNAAPANSMPPSEQIAPERPVDEEALSEAAGLNAASVFRIFESVLNDARSRDRYRITKPRQLELEVIINRLKTSFPESYEYHYAQWLNSPLDTAVSFHLMEAYRLAPDQAMLLDDLVVHFELTGDLEQKARYCKLIEEETLYDPALYSYARNIFRSIPTGAFLFTQGEWDTYPLWVLQHVHNERTDVTILQLDLLHQEQYFNKVMKPLALSKGSYNRFLRNKQAFFRELAEATKKKQLFLSLTLDRSILEYNADVLYNTGLAMKLTNSHFNNMKILTENWSSFELEHLNVPGNNPDLYKMMGNYIFPLGLLHQQAVVNQQDEEAMVFKGLMMTLARNAGLENEMKRYLEE
jgi:hypothetical protein